MNLKGISVVVVVAVVILLIVLLPIKPGDMPPTILDEAIFDEEVTLKVKPSDLETDTVDSPDVIESTVVENQTAPKHFVRNATDVPSLSG
ncbi:MAG: putative Sec-independent protein translocase protein TatA [Nitrosopumilales archaeon]|nr:MAG: putative Sec-independent protein translocase protein TatA [Nitrosopumilales archaeon]